MQTTYVAVPRNERTCYVNKSHLVGYSRNTNKKTKTGERNERKKKRIDTM